MPESPCPVRPPESPSSAQTTIHLFCVKTAQIIFFLYFLGGPGGQTDGKRRFRAYAILGWKRAPNFVCSRKLKTRFGRIFYELSGFLAYDGTEE